MPLLGRGLRWRGACLGDASGIVEEEEYDFEPVSIKVDTKKVRLGLCPATEGGSRLKADEGVASEDRRGGFNAERGEF